MSNLDPIKDATIAGQRRDIEAIINQALAAAYKPEDIIQNGFIPAMNIVGKRFQTGELFIPEMLMAAQTMARGMELLKPLMVKQKVETVATVVLGTVQGDMHDIGKNLVRIMMEGVGFQVIDIGINVPPAKFVTAAKEHKPQIIGLSALLTTTLPAMQITIEALKAAQLQDSPYVLVGGAPVSAAFAEKIGADGYGKDAAEAVEVARGFIPYA
jgi:5-methyltetrahydrofolate--homocysteine methyltransferase